MNLFLMALLIGFCGSLSHNNCSPSYSSVMEVFLAFSEECQQELSTSVRG